MTFREMTKADLDFVSSNSISRGIISKQPEVTDWNYALEHEGLTLGIGGIRLITESTAWGWIEITHYAVSHITTAYRTIKEWTDILCKNQGITRLQVYVAVDFPEALRTAEHLGFHKEYDEPMRNFLGNGKDAYLFVRHFK